MINIPYIKIPQIGIGGIPSTLNVYPAQEGRGNVPNNQPTPVTYLTQWKIVGNSEVHGNEIWSCGEYNPTDGKYHILVQPLGGRIADIALTEPLRKIGDVADSIEYADGVTTATRNIAIAWWKDMDVIYQLINNQYVSNYERFYTTSLNNVIGNTTVFGNSICLSANYEQNHAPVSLTSVKDFCMCVFNKILYIRDIDCHSKADFKAKNANNYFFYVLETPTTELVDAPQIQEADSYSCVISPDGKAVSWSNFETEVIP